MRARGTRPHSSEPRARAALRPWRGLAVASGAVILLLLAPGVAAAHAGFVSSQPEAGAELGTAPGVVVIRFSEPLNKELSRATVVAPDGRQAHGRAIADDEITIELTTGEQGVYEVGWTTVSLVDGHTLSGSFRFGVGVSPGAGAEGGTADEPTLRDLAIALARLVEDVGLLSAIGLLLLRRLSRREPAIGWVRTPLRVALGLALAGGLFVVGGEALAAAPSSSLRGAVSYLTTGLPGIARSIRPALEALALVSARRRLRWTAPATTAAVVALAAAGHAAAIRPAVLGIAVEAAHVLSAGLWAGGVIALAIQRPPKGWRDDEGRRLIDRFTPVALVSFVVTANAGILRGVQEVGSFRSLFASAYGLVLLLKVLAVVIMVELSVLAWRRLAVHARAEATVAVLVVAAAALLSSFPLPPARVEEAVGQQRPTGGALALPRGGAELTLGAHAGQVLVGLTIRPAAPGPNALFVYVLGLDGPSATAALPVTAWVSGAKIALVQCGDSCRSGRTDLKGGERVRIRVGASAGGTATFHLPKLPAQPGGGLLRRMLGAMHALTSYRQDETLSSGLATVRSTYAFVAPHSFKSRTVQPGSQTRTVWIGGTRYLRQDQGSWQVETGGPSIPVPSFVWESFAPYLDPWILGKAEVDGVRAKELSFFGGDSQTPVWFRLWVGPDGLVRKAQMRAPGHFMDHRYHAFDRPISIEPPKGVQR